MILIKNNINSNNSIKKKQDPKLLDFLAMCVFKVLVKVAAVLTAYTLLFVLDHILVPRIEILFCPIVVFQRGISSAICYLVLYLFKSRCKNIFEIGCCQLILEFKSSGCSGNLHSVFYNEPFYFIKVYDRDVSARRKI